jgi:sodium-dependent phosphate cotransporter
MGANIGTTVTAILAALGTGNPVAVTVSFAHLIFNVYGIVIFYPLRFIPIGIARTVGHFAGQSVRNVVIVITIFILLYLMPLTIFLT